MSAHRVPPPELLGFLWNQSIDMLSITDMTSGRFEFLNEAWERTTGFTRGELAAEPFLAFVHPDDRDRTAEKAGEMVEQGADAVEFENRYRHKDGGWRWMRWNSRMGPDERAFSVTTDVTDRHRAERFLRLYAEAASAANTSTQLDEALKRAIDVVCDVFDWPVGHAYRPDDDGTLVPTGMWRENGGAETYETLRSVTAATTFRPGEGLPGRAYASESPQLVRDVTDEPWFVRSRSAGIGVRGAFAFPVCASGVVDAVLEFFTPDPISDDDEMLRVAGNVGAVLGQVIERERAQAAEEGRVEAQRLYLSMVTHDLRTPLTGVKGMSELLLGRWQTLDDTGRQELLETLNSSADHAFRIVNTYLDQRRASPEGLEARPQLLDLRGAVETAVALVRVPDVTVDVAEGLDVVADPDFLGQILANLLTNASKYGAPPFEVTATVQGTFHVDLAVRDRGPGVDDAFVPQLFERFSQHDESDDGVGLGLAICRDLAVAQKGDLRYEAADPGARFVVELLRPSG